MKQYTDILTRALTQGRREPNRTGIDALVLRPAMMEFDLAEGFPAVTTKRLAFNACKGEFIAFMQGKTSAADFRALGCNFWDANANENEAWLKNPNRAGHDDLGSIYGAQWRAWPFWDYDAMQPGAIDQVLNALREIRFNPTSRRIIISAWNPAEFDRMALHPCHVLYQFMVDTERAELSLAMYQRSADLFLGVPMNIASCGLMLSLFAAMTGLTPRYITHFMAIPHLYVNHVEQAAIQVLREPLPLPRLVIDINDMALDMRNDAEIISHMRPDDFRLIGYESHAPLTGKMAV